ncbi:MAG: bifunctional diaminohydroxyphosphoribosylaminopyrimidine deaminase/5-amino-6-(5-phosphoribosylamino)uracil reductase RibD [Elusimicrobia bacterium]|nr:bifunctional diaminohydroxyphosphoribosylaminopyrimidine deaminase/5-amino-6-(5-phosphoribosylamino)uracil reductase RibD [Elusimicrobiota bacterium]
MNVKERFMSKALKEALKGDPFAYPNPLVGCVIVKKGKIIGKGYHGFFGGPHAEPSAVKNCSESAKGADFYITMEPCSSINKKTPPCTDLLLQIKPKKVFIGSLDPNPAHNGKGVEILRKAGIKTETGILSKECENINSSFFKNMKENMPYVILKFAQSLNGKIADNKGNSRWISCEESRFFSQKLRAGCDCIIAGAKTIIKDNPLLTVRYPKAVKQPSVCIIDGCGKIPLNASVFKADRKVFIVVKKGFSFKGKIPKNARILEIPLKGDFLNNKILLKKLYKEGIRRILVEGGGETHGQFVFSGLFDEIYAFISPIIIGQKNSPSSVVWPDNYKIKKGLGIELKLKEEKNIGKDKLLIFGK